MKRRIISIILVIALAVNSNIALAATAFAESSEETAETENTIKVASVSLGCYYSAAVTSNGDLYCWGWNDYGRVGKGTTNKQTTPVKVLSNVASVSIWDEHSAAVTTNGDLYCWGHNQYGQVGNGTTKTQTTPVKVLSNVASVSVSNTHSAAVTSNGDLYCWGYNKYGQVGNGTTENQLSPVKVLSNVASVFLKGNHSAAVTTNGDLYCWGYNEYGQVGNETTENQLSPVKVLSNVSIVSFGVEHSAAVTENGDLYCWGYNKYGQVGNGTTENQTSPVKVLSNVSIVSFGVEHSAAVTENGDLYCWGYNKYGQVGNGTTENQTSPVKVLSNVANVSFGENHSAAVTMNGDLYCWGYNKYGQVGNETTENQSSPVKVLSNVSSVSLGSCHSAAVTENGDLYCWGGNWHGQVGNGTTENQLTPVKVLGNNTEDGTDSSTDDDSFSPKLQCSRSCSVEVGHTQNLSAKAYEDSLEQLKNLTSNVTWESENPEIATVENKGFVLPAHATKYTTGEGSYETWEATGIAYVKGVSEGTTQITGTSSDGSKVSCSVTVTESEDGANDKSEGNGGSLVLGEDASGSADSSVAEFFPANWSLKSSTYPVEISKTTDEKNGTYTIKGTVGIGRSDWLDDETKWSSYKKNVSDAKKYTGRVDCLKSYKNTWGVKSLTAVSTDKFEVLPKLSVMGYFENTYDKNGNLISTDGGFAADAKWSGSINWQFVTPIGPMYLNLKGSGKLSGKLEPAYDYANKSLKISDGSLKFTPSVSLEGGYGIDKVAQIGAQGTLSVPITIIPASKGEFEASAALHVKLIFVIDYTHDLASYKKTIWDTSNQKKRAKNSNILQVSEGTFSEMDTSFAKSEGKWNGNTLSKKMKKMGKKIAESITNNITTIQEGILPSSLPMQVQYAGKNVMVFQAYDESRTTLNSAVLKYSVLENGVWSEPKAVSDDGCADMYADMKVVNDKLVLVWQKEKNKISGDVENDSDSVLKDIATNSEIYFSTFDEETNTFTTPTLVTENDEYDMMPQICNDSDDIIVSWVRNDAADIMQESGSNTIYTAKWNGSSFEQEEALTQAPGTVDKYVVYQNTEGLQTIFSGQSNDITAVFNTDGQVISELSELMTASEDGTISNINYVDGTVNFIQNGTLYSYNTSNGEVTSATAGESAFGSAVQYCSNGSKSAYVWSVYDEETKKGSILASMKTENGYSEPVTICEKENTIWRYFSPVLDSDGNWQIVVNGLDTESNLNSLQYVTKKQESKLELAGVSVNENDVVDGLTAVDYFVSNSEDTEIQNIEIEITLEDGSKIKKEVPVTILPGESKAGTAYIDLGDIDTAQNVTISVTAEDQTNTSDCIVTEKIGNSDVSIDAVSTETEDEVKITTTLQNLSNVKTNATVHLYGDEKKTTELQKKEKITLKAKESNEITFTVKKKDITYNQNNAAYLMLNAVTENEDYNEDNNTAYVVLYQSDSLAEATPTPDSGDSSASVTGSSTATATPVPTAVLTLAPTNEAVPTLAPTTAPAVTTVPTVSPSNNSSKEKDANTFSANTKALKKGTKVTDKTTKAVYKVTSAGKKKTVEYVKSTKKNPKSVTIPATVKLNGKTYKVTSIGKRAFAGSKKLTSVKIGKNVKKIGKQAFYSCKKLRYFMVKTNHLSLGSVGKSAFGNGYSKPRVKTNKKMQKRYSKIFLSRGMSKKCVIYH